MNAKLKLTIQRVISVTCAVLIALISVFYQISIPVFASSADWSSLGEDAVALKDAYLRYLNGWGNGSLCDIIGGAVDVPISWYKTLSDGVKAISPVDDWAYYLTEEDQTSGGGGHVRTGDSSSHASDRPSSEVTPVLPSETFKQVATYWADYYKPMPTTSEYKISYQSRECTTSKYYGIGLVPVFLDAYGSWGKKNWSGVYLLPFLSDDDLAFYSYYCNSYYHFYSGREDDVLYLYLDVYSLENNTITSSYKYIWDAVTYPFIGCYINTNLSCELVVYEFKLYSDYLNVTNYTELAAVKLGKMIASDYSTNTGALYSLRGKSTFTPNTNKNDDWGYYLSADPFELFATQTSIDFDKIPDNYTITINGDTIYDYSITNPDTGDTSTINEYVTNNYTYITNNNGSDSGSGSGSSGGSVSGNVDVSGAVVVGGQIDIKSDPIDINININGGSSGSGSSGTGEARQPYVDGENVDLTEYLDHVPEVSKGFTDYLQDFFAWLPKEIYGLIVLALVVCIWCRLAGR